MTDFLMNPEEIPFSRSGSWMCFSIFSKKQFPQLEKPLLFLRNVRVTCNLMPLYAVELLDKDGNVLEDVQWRFTASCLTGSTCHSRAVRFIFDGNDSVRFQSPDLGIRFRQIPDLTKGLIALQVRPDRVRSIAIQGGNYHNFFYHFKLESGRMQLHSRWNGTDSGGFTLDFMPNNLEMAAGVILESQEEWPLDRKWRDFDEIEAETRQEFETFLSGFRCPPCWHDAMVKAAFMNWSFFVSPWGYVKRRAMLVSKYFMSGIWAWDHCFNAIALAESHPEMAYDQFMVIMDQMDRQGCLPDLISGEIKMRVFTKPPVHGWAYAQMCYRNPEFFTAGERLTPVFRILEKWTRFWLDVRDPDHTGYPLYYHGNDSGLDNSSWFIQQPPLSSPELLGYLIYQTGFLADIAEASCQPSKALEWQMACDRLVRQLSSEMYRKGEFLAFSPQSGFIHQKGDSLIPYLSLVAAKRLPAAMRAEMIRTLKDPNRFLTSHGFASE